MDLDLLGAVGQGRDNLPDDVRKTSFALQSLGYGGPSSPIDDFSQTDDGLDHQVARFQFDEGLKVDGFLRPDGPTENRINRRLADGSGPSHRGVSLGDRPVVNLPQPFALPNEGFRQFGFGAAPPTRSSAPNQVDRHDGIVSILGPIGPRGVVGRGPHTPFASTRAPVTEPPTRSRGKSARQHLSFEEKAKVLEGQGFSYVPDPMGRINQGHWEDGNGNPVDSSTIDHALRRGASEVASPGRRQPLMRRRSGRATHVRSNGLGSHVGQKRHAGSQVRVDADGFLPLEPGERVVPLPDHPTFQHHLVADVRRRDFDSPEEFEEFRRALSNQGQIEPANFRKLSRWMEKTLGRRRPVKPGQLDGYKTYPKKLRRMVNRVTDERTRKAIAAILRGGRERKGSDRNVFDVIVERSRRRAIVEFGVFVRRAGGSFGK